MNEIVSNFLLAGNKFMPEMHLRQPGFTYSAYGTFTTNKRRIQKFKETGDLRYVYQNKLDKACFQHGIAYGDFKKLTRRTASDKILRDKAFNIAKNPKYDRYQRGLASIFCKFFTIRRCKKRKVHSTFIDNIWGADLADMQLISRFNKGFRFLLCVIDIHSKYAWVIPLKDKKGITITNAFQKVLDESKRKPNEIWVDKGSKVYNR